MRSNLERFQMTKLRPFKDKIQRQYLSANVSPKAFHLCLYASINDSPEYTSGSLDYLTIFQVTGHLEEMLQTAHNKFHAWQTRRMMRKT